MLSSKMILELIKRDIAMALSAIITIIIIVAGVSFVAGYQSAKNEVRASYCEHFTNDPRCK